MKSNPTQDSPSTDVDSANRACDLRVVNLQHLPIETVVHGSRLDPAWFVARAGLMVSSASGAQQAILGFAAAHDVDDASARARFEVRERLMSHYTVASRDGARDCPIRYAKQGSSRVGPPISLQSVCWGVPGQPTNDTSGVAHGASVDDAAERALWELIERHMAVLAWHERALLEEVAPPIQLGRGQVRFVTLANTPVAFCMACFRLPHEGLWLAGTAAAPTMARARNKAFEEVVMLSESALDDDALAVGQQAIAERMATLRGDISSARQSFIEGRISPTRGAKWEDSLNAATAARYLWGPDLELVFALLYDSSEGSVVRALCTGALSAFRGDCDAAPVPHPYC